MNNNYKKPKKCTIRYGEYKGEKITAYINRDDKIHLPAIHGNDTYTSLDEFIWSHPENARDIAGFLLEWADWAEDYLESDKKRKQWLLKETSEGLIK